MIYKINKSQIVNLSINSPTDDALLFLSHFHKLVYCSPVSGCACHLHLRFEEIRVKLRFTESVRTVNVYLTAVYMEFIWGIINTCNFQDLSMRRLTLKKKHCHLCGVKTGFFEKWIG